MNDETSKLIAKVERFARQEQLFAPAEPGRALHLCAAVSGGADSMALLHCLRRTGKDFAVANCNFHLRGSESDRDSKFVEGICRKDSIPLYKMDFDVEEDMRKNGGSMEMSCRRLRYDWVRPLKAEKGSAGYSQPTTATTTRRPCC